MRCLKKFYHTYNILSEPKRGGDKAQCQLNAKGGPRLPGHLCDQHGEARAPSPGQRRLGSPTRPNAAQKERPASLRTGPHTLPWGLRPNRARCGGGRQSLRDVGHECSHRKDLVMKELETGDVPAGKATCAHLCACLKQGHWRAETRG